MSAHQQEILSVGVGWVLQGWVGGWVTWAAAVWGWGRKVVSGGQGGAMRNLELAGSQTKHADMEFSPHNQPPPYMLNHSTWSQAQQVMMAVQLHQ